MNHNSISDLELIKYIEDQNLLPAIRLASSRFEHIRQQLEQDENSIRSRLQKLRKNLESSSDDSNDDNLPPIRYEFVSTSRPSRLRALGQMALGLALGLLMAIVFSHFQPSVPQMAPSNNRVIELFALVPREDSKLLTVGSLESRPMSSLPVGTIVVIRQSRGRAVYHALAAVPPQTVGDDAPHFEDKRVQQVESNSAVRLDQAGVWTIVVGQSSSPVDSRLLAGRVREWEGLKQLTALPTRSGVWRADEDIVCLSRPVLLSDKHQIDSQSQSLFRALRDYIQQNTGIVEPTVWTMEVK